MADYIDWPGASGQTYRYFFIDVDLSIDPVSANYAIVQLMSNGAYVPLYFGEAGTASTRITRSHEKWVAAVTLGYVRWMAHSTQGGERARCAEEQDLIARWQPVLNIQHRQVW